MREKITGKKVSEEMQLNFDIAVIRKNNIELLDCQVDLIYL